MVYGTFYAFFISHIFLEEWFLITAVGGTIVNKWTILEAHSRKHVSSSLDEIYHRPLSNLFAFPRRLTSPSLKTVPPTRSDVQLIIYFEIVPTNYRWRYRATSPDAVEIPRSIIRFPKRSAVVRNMNFTALLFRRFVTIPIVLREKNCRNRIK